MPLVINVLSFVVFYWFAVADSCDVFKSILPEQLQASGCSKTGCLEIQNKCSASDVRVGHQRDFEPKAGARKRRKKHLRLVIDPRASSEFFGDTYCD